MQQPRVPTPQIVYGRTIFWLVIVAALINAIGPLMAMAFPDNNLLDPQRIFASIWAGSSPDTVWRTAGGGFPGGHFWLSYPNTWDGFMQLGLVIGCASAFLALLPTAMAFLREKPRSYGWALISLLVSATAFSAALGIVAA
jgi:hypothetical protein